MLSAVAARFSSPESNISPGLDFGRQVTAATGLIWHIVFSRSIAVIWFLAVILIVIDLDLAVI
jgi:hypothetical protein